MGQPTTDPLRFDLAQLLVETKSDMQGLTAKAEALLEAKSNAKCALDCLRSRYLEFKSQLTVCQDDANWVFNSSADTTDPTANLSVLPYNEACVTLGRDPDVLCHKIFSDLSPTLRRMALRAPGWNREWPFDRTA